MIPGFLFTQLAIILNMLSQMGKILGTNNKKPLETIIQFIYVLVTMVLSELSIFQFTSLVSKAAKFIVWIVK